MAIGSIRMTTYDGFMMMKMTMTPDVIENKMTIWSSAFMTPPPLEEQDSMQCMYWSCSGIEALETQFTN